MAVPSYTEDLTDLTTAESATSWVEMTGSIGGESYNANGIPAGGDPDYPFIQGSYSVTQDCTKDTSVGSICYNNGSGTGGHGTDGAYFVWQNFMVAGNIGTYAQGGFQIVVGSGLGDFDVWYVGGSDKAPYPYGGWVNNVVNTTVTADGTAGTPTATEQYIGSAVYVVTGPKKGEVHNCDVIRYGRGSAIFEHGETSNYCTIAGFVTQNDNSSNRWGLIQETSGGYLWKGRISLGTASNAVDFRDSDRIIFIQWCPKVTSNFNTIEVLNASSNIEMTNFQFIQLDTTTASLGRWITTNDATVTLTNCSFQDMGTFDFDSNTTALNCSWVRCLQIDPQQADLSYSSVLESAVTGGGADGGGALLWDVNADPNTYLNDMTFTKGSGSHHAIEFGTSAPQTMSLTNMTFTDFSTSNQQTTSTLYFQDTGSDVTWTVNLIDCSSNITYYKERSGDTVNLVAGAVTVAAHATDENGNDVASAQVYMRAKAKSSGTATTDTSNKLVDTNATFQDDGVAVGDVAYNQTDGTSATVSAIDSQTSLSLDSDAFPDGNEDYRVGGSLPVLDTVTIVNSGTTATVTHTGHGMLNNDYVYIRGGSLHANNGVFQITYINANSYSYTMGSTPGSSPTGTITSTFVALWGTTDASGDKSTTRVYSVDQPFTGWIRKYTGDPYLKEAPLSGTIDTANGVSIIGVLVSDE